MPAAPRPTSLARRAFPALALTGVSGALIALLDHPSSTVSAGAGTTATTPVATAAGPLPRGSDDDRQPPVVSTPATAAPATRPGPCTGSTVDGPTVDTRWGPVQVAVTVAPDGKVCDVEPLQYPNDNRRSAAINQRALPVLHTRALSEGASFDAVSGATVTSEGYRASLQAALDH